MIPVVGIICEYDPFHLGHKHQFDLIHELLPDAKIVCLMSGCFTQRGSAALHAPRIRAEAALRAGADMVFELPCAYAVRDAEHFALGGVEILTRMGFVTYLSFGAEDEPNALLPAAQLLEQPTSAFSGCLKQSLENGSSFAKAQGEALQHCLPSSGSPWNKPNSILALCYLRALLRLQSPLVPLPVLREGDYHADTLTHGAWPSATAIRKAFLNGEHEKTTAFCGYPLPKSPICLPDALDRLLLFKLRTADIEVLRALPDCTEGLEYRLKTCAAASQSRTGLLERLKTKRYPYARLSRLCTHALLDMPQALLDAFPHPPYVRLLGLRRDAGALTARFAESTIPILSKAADVDSSHQLLQLDKRAYALWALGANVADGLIFRQGIVTL